MSRLTLSTQCALKSFLHASLRYNLVERYCGSNAFLGLQTPVTFLSCPGLPVAIPYCQEISFDGQL